MNESIKGTKTEENLTTAFAGESGARNKYTYYAAKAAKEGYEQIADIFKETAHNECEHAKLWFELLHNGIPDTIQNLKDAAAGEHGEWVDMYKEFADMARQEGFDRIAYLFEEVGKIEKEHEIRYETLREHILQNTTFEKSKPVTWQCTNCGFSIHGTTAPTICPVCSHSQGYFQLKATNY